jgi:ribosomal protein L28
MYTSNPSHCHVHINNFVLYILVLRHGKKVQVSSRAIRKAAKEKAIKKIEQK